MPTESLTALYFPTTWIPAATAARLLLPFDHLLSYRPAEVQPTMPQPFAASGLVKAYPPVPLGDELGRFRQLVKDMEVHATEYYQAYLSSLAAPEEDFEANWRQVARQLTQTTSARDAKEDSLWRARLYLALAENQTLREEELATGIRTIARREAELLRQLQGETEELAELQILPTAPIATALARDEQLLAAWGLLYLADTRPELPRLLTTARAESAALLFETYEQMTGRRPEKLLTLALQSLPTGSEEEFAENRQTLRTAAHDSLARIDDFLTRAFSTEADTGADDFRQAATELAAAWQQTMPFADTAMKKPAAEDDVPGPTAAATLTFYRLSGVSFSGLFRRFCRQEEGEATGASSPNAIMAVMTE